MRLVATANTLDEFVTEVEGLLVRGGIEAKCSLHMPADSLLLDDIFHASSASYSNGPSSESEVLGDLRLSRTIHMTNSLGDSGEGKGCKCLKIQCESLVLIPVPISTYGLSWISIQILNVRTTLHVSEEFIESLKWALFLLIEHDTQSQICHSCSETKPLKMRSYQNNTDLTRRQNQIVILVREEMANSDIGIVLHISTSLVKMELGKVFKILGISNRKELFDQ